MLCYPPLSLSPCVCVCVCVCVQRAAIVERLQEMTHAAYLCGVNVICYQEACSE